MSLPDRAPWYYEYLPNYLFYEQIAWDRRALVARGRAAGLKRREMAAHLGISPGRVGQLLDRWDRHQRRGAKSPLERYFTPFGAELMDVACSKNPSTLAMFVRQLDQLARGAPQ